MSFPLYPPRAQVPQPPNVATTNTYYPGQPRLNLQQPNDAWATRAAYYNPYPIQPIIFWPSYSVPPPPPVNSTVPLPQPADTYVSQSVADTKPDDLYLYIAAKQQRVVSFDLRRDPRMFPPAPNNQGHDRASIFRCPTKSIRLICREFPWSIEIDKDVISCKDVWEAVYDALQVRITSEEWAIVGETKRREIQHAVELRRGGPMAPGSMPPRRIDWLGNMAVFDGLEKDEALVRERMVPWASGRDTLAIRLTRR